MHPLRLELMITRQFDEMTNSERFVAPFVCRRALVVDNDTTDASRRRYVESTLSGHCDLRRAGQARLRRSDRGAARHVR